MACPEVGLLSGEPRLDQQFEEILQRPLDPLSQAVAVMPREARRVVHGPQNQVVQPQHDRNVSGLTHVRLLPGKPSSTFLPLTARQGAPLGLNGNDAKGKSDKGQRVIHGVLGTHAATRKPTLL
jgi:hypothetical protein